MNMNRIYPGYHITSKRYPNYVSYHTSPRLYVGDNKQITRTSEGLTCARCGALGELRCSRCKVIVYCTRECQVADWATHRRRCDLYKSTLGIPSIRRGFQNLSRGQKMLTLLNICLTDYYKNQTASNNCTNSSTKSTTVSTDTKDTATNFNEISDMVAHQKLWLSFLPDTDTEPFYRGAYAYTDVGSDAAEKPKHYYSCMFNCNSEFSADRSAANDSLVLRIITNKGINVSIPKEQISSRFEPTVQTCPNHAEISFLQRCIPFCIEAARSAEEVLTVLCAINTWGSPESAYLSGYISLYRDWLSLPRIQMVTSEKKLVDDGTNSNLDENYINPRCSSSNINLTNDTGETDVYRIFKLAKDCGCNCPYCYIGSLMVQSIVQGFVCASTEVQGEAPKSSITSRNNNEDGISKGNKFSAEEKETKTTSQEGADEDKEKRREKYGDTSEKNTKTEEKNNCEKNNDDNSANAESVQRRPRLVLDGFYEKMRKIAADESQPFIKSVIQREIAKSAPVSFLCPLCYQVNITPDRCIFCSYQLERTRVSEEESDTEIENSRAEVLKSCIGEFIGSFYPFTYTNDEGVAKRLIDQLWMDILCVRMSLSEKSKTIVRRACGASAEEANDGSRDRIYNNNQFLKMVNLKSLPAKVQLLKIVSILESAFSDPDELAFTQNDRFCINIDLMYIYFTLADVTIFLSGTSKSTTIRASINQYNAANIEKQVLLNQTLHYFKRLDSILGELLPPPPERIPGTNDYSPTDVARMTFYAKKLIPPHYKMLALGELIGAPENSNMEETLGSIRARIDGFNSWLEKEDRVDLIDENPDGIEQAENFDDLQIVGRPQ